MVHSGRHFVFGVRAEACAKKKVTVRVETGNTRICSRVGCGLNKEKTPKQLLLTQQTEYVAGGDELCKVRSARARKSVVSTYSKSVTCHHQRRLQALLVLLCMPRTDAAARVQMQGGRGAHELSPSAILFGSIDVGTRAMLLARGIGHAFGVCP